jgi:hypothetical protein
LNVLSRRVGVGSTMADTDRYRFIGVAGGEFTGARFHDLRSDAEHAYTDQGLTVTLVKLDGMSMASCNIDYRRWII